MACNLPIVSVPAGDVAEVISGTGGCYLCSQVPEDVAEKLQMALQFGGRTNGREKIDYMDFKSIGQQLVSLYDGLLKEKKNGRQPSNSSGNKSG
jgi:teichuronic acid biosynthesis glycosyltransferase TuaC